MIKHLSDGNKPPKRMLLLGFTGFVGKEISAYICNQGIEVVEISSQEIDLCAPDSVGKLKEVLRENEPLVFASAITPDKGKDARTMMKNLAMAEHVGAALEQVPCSQVIYISSDAVYGEDVNPVRENAPCDSGSLYGHMHRARELIVKTAAAKHKIPFLALRPCAIYGAGDTHRSYGPNRFMQTSIKEGQIALFGNGDEKRDHLFIDDFTQLIEQCLVHRSEGFLNVATGTSHTFRQVADMVAEITGGKTQVKPSPQVNPVTHRHFDITELLRAFPDFRFTPLKEGLTLTYKILVKL